MRYERIEGVTVGMNPHPYVEFKGKKVAFIAQHSLVDLRPIYFPKVADPKAPRTPVWYVYRAELSEDGKTIRDGGIKVLSDAFDFKTLAVNKAESLAINEQE